MTNADEGIFVDALGGDLHLLQTAPASITAGGSTQFSDSVGQVAIPKTDMDEAARGTSIAIGALDILP